MIINMKNNILINLLNKQLNNIDSKKKLNLSDINRICKNLNTSIFGSECSIWQGYITKLKKNNDKYINFFFKGKKYALHRLLYTNYIGELNKKEYLKYTCDNKGSCCNINHYKKVVKNKKDNKPIINKKNINMDINNKIEILDFEDSQKKLIIIF